MSLVKEIEKHLKQKSNNVEAVEDILIQDSVLDHSEVPDFNEYEDTTPGEIRKKAPIDLGSEYSGKPISRQAFSTSKLQADSDFKNALKVLLSDDEEDRHSTEIEEENEQSNLENLDLENEQSETDLDDQVDEEEDESQGEEEASQNEEESEDNESDGYDDDVNLADYENQKQPVEKDKIEIFSAKAKDVGSDVTKGNAIRNQLSIWETLLECRIKMQPCIIAGNQLYQKDKFEKFKSELTKVDEAVIDKTYASLSNMMKTLLDVQESLSLVSSEYQNFLKNQESSKNNINDNHSDTEMNVDDDDDESIESSLASGEDQEKENESENVSSEDEDIEEAPKAKKAKVTDSKNFIKDTYEQFKPFGESSIRKWYERTKVASGKASSSDFSAFDQSPLKQIEHILYDKERLIKKTQLLRSDYGILGKQIEVEKPIDEVEALTSKSKVQNEYDEEIFDDNDFYHKLLRDFIERKSTDVTDPLKHGRQWLELQKMRSKLKRKVDTKASKGRKLRYTVHNKLVSFMAPIPNNQWTPEAEEKLFSSLFGKATVK
ncbi:protein AATF [Cimex lectularius]|uniref:Protein AATF n=1 Tax=Cimex lectularius TaxID=79782 RepID=A0A8I6RIH7_CIMLE|nr:protein AATF [Cimex lectularius]